MLGRRSGVVVAALLLLVLALFLVTGKEGASERLKSRPNTATPHPTKPVATAVKP